MSPHRPSPPATATARPDPRARLRLARRAGGIALAGVLLVAGPAGAHPFVRGGELPVDSLATMTLTMAHGCGSEASGEGEPTTDVSLEVPAWLRVVDVPDEDGWSIDLEQDEGGTLEVVTWTADTAQEPAPDFDLDVVATGEVGEERHLRVFQACDEFVYRWVGTPDEPADDPAIRVTLAAPDPSSPPPEPEPADDPSPEPDEPDGSAPADEEADVEADAGDADQADDGATQTGETDGATQAGEAEDGLPGWFLPVTFAVLAGAIGAVLIGRRGRADT